MKYSTVIGDEGKTYGGACVSVEADSFRESSWQRIVRWDRASCGILVNDASLLVCGVTANTANAVLLGAVDR